MCCMGELVGVNIYAGAQELLDQSAAGRLSILTWSSIIGRRSAGCVSVRAGVRSYIQAQPQQSRIYAALVSECQPDPNPGGMYEDANSRQFSY